MTALSIPTRAAARKSLILVPTRLDPKSWLNVAQSAQHAGRHPVTLRRALEAQELHGHQRMAGGHWRIRAGCLDAWIAGEQCEHQLADTG